MKKIFSVLVVLAVMCSGLFARVYQMYENDENLWIVDNNQIHNTYYVIPDENRTLTELLLHWVTVFDKAPEYINSNNTRLNPDVAFLTKKYKLSWAIFTDGAVVNMYDKSTNTFQTYIWYGAYY